MPEVSSGIVTDLVVYEDQNPNVGTQRGLYLREKSLEKCKTGRSVVVDRNNRVICGEKMVLACVDAEIDNTIVVETEGDALVVHKRVDLDMDNDPNAWLLALFDNVSGREAALNVARVLELGKAGVSISDVFKPFVIRRMEKKLEQASREVDCEEQEEDSGPSVRTLRFDVEEGAALVIDSQIDRICSSVGCDKGEALEKMALLASRASDSDLK